MLPFVESWNAAFPDAHEKKLEHGRSSGVLLFLVPALVGDTGRSRL